MTNALFGLTGRTAVVTGGTRGIGMMVAAGLLSAGASVIISSRSAEACAEAVLVRAEGRVVSAGVDIGLFRKIADPAEGQRLFTEMIELATRVNRLPCPTVFVAHGLCLTWAFELALACDFIVAARSASFGLIEATVGLTPSMGGTQRLAERVGIGRARNLVMTAARLGAEQLWHWGGIDQVVDDDALEAEALRLAGHSRPDRPGPTRLPRPSCAVGLAAESRKPIGSPPLPPARSSTPTIFAAPSTAVRHCASEIFEDVDMVSLCALAG